MENGWSFSWCYNIVANHVCNLISVDCLSQTLLDAMFEERVSEVFCLNEISSIELKTTLFCLDLLSRNYETPFQSKASATILSFKTKQGSFQFNA
jgi:hypothetical protein